MRFRPDARLLVLFLPMGFALFASALAHSATIPRGPAFRSKYLALECEAFGVIPPTRTPLVLGDFNRDGALDMIVVADRRYTTLSIRFGDGYGNFGPLLDVGVAPPSAISALCVDYDRDGKLDLLIGCLGVNVLAAMRGHGDGTFDAPISSATPFDPNVIAAGDMNEDGILDVAIGKGFGAAKFGVMVGDGAGHFSLTAQGNLDNVLQIVLADMNRDGHLDLVSSHAGVHLGDGHGGFSSFVPYPNDPTGEALLVRDLDGDGWLDVVRSVSSLGLLRVHYGLAGGGFDASREASYPFGSGVRGLAVADLDHDGVPELLASADEFRILSVGHGGQLSLEKTLPIPGQGAPSWLMTADLDGDHWTDVVIVASNAIGVYFGSPDGMGTGPTALDLSATPGAMVKLPGPRIALLQPDVDSLLIVYAAPSGAMSVDSRLATGHRPFALLTADLDGDGGSDIIVGDSASVTLLRDNGAGSWVRSDVQGVPNMRWLAAGDLDQDGRVDLVTGNDELGSIYVLPGTIAGFGAPQLASADLAQGDAACIADFDQDGNLDLAVGQGRPGADQRLVTMAGDGALGFVRRWTQERFGGVDMSVVDWNQDGAKDIFFAAPDFVGGGQNSGHFQFGYAGWGFQNGGNSYLAHGAFADVDMDGQMDGVGAIAARTYALLYTRASDEAATWAYGFAATPLDHVLLADLTDDGLPDLVATEPASKRLWLAPHVAAPTTSVREDREMDGPLPTLRFGGSVPNPARASGMLLRFDRLAPARIRVEILDARGRTVRRLFDGKATDDSMRFSWDGRDDNGSRVAAGIYFARAAQPDLEERSVATGKLVLLP